MNRPISWLRSLWAPSPPQYSALPQSTTPVVTDQLRYRCWSPRVLLRRLPLLIRIALGILLVDILGTAIFFPSYTHLPPCYESLKAAASSSNAPGRANPRNETVYIAAILYDRTGDLAGGQWGAALTTLIHLLGEDNVFLSLYENNSGSKGEAALQSLSHRIPCNKSIVIDQHTPFTTFPHTTLPNGESRIKRIDYLAALRNRALDPLTNHTTHFDKLLYLNDVLFDPLEAAQLLFCTNNNTNTNTNTHTHTPSSTSYRAACAVDFSNPFKFYDTYATRDLQGYGTGLPFFPWFTTAGRGESRRDVLAGRDAVRVRSCWGGMVAFDATYFQKQDPVRFRADAEVFWDASECCLIHADIQDGHKAGGAEGADTGVYMNPFVRVAYSARSLRWLKTTRRFERLYPLAHDVLNRIVGLPWYNPRRGEVAGEKVEREVWVADGSVGGGAFRTVEVVAGKDGFCGRRGMEVVVEDRKPGQDGFEPVPVPVPVPVSSSLP
ncbi:glycosyltransferase family 69 protein [Aspergillus clavatus NRRL 1]|uniref:Uncharacterized protein n=1 Tax=Aspergillus clavatus (strain ATCC 1007 / CBS 513.65 / DSM 816 / NCTC 3887 / NRRL 1 / QM 1276 / 107) TaxID=344612 RepID=A1C8L6_ASPCL|nr:uncharacterized protein ACLA_043730 [Aspergillus clavatus NRRL 1]EAW13653.1 conserved hypothetical protein [Aspergillus clavatus NRRL 1]